MTHTKARGRIVVGVDGSAASAATVRWAVREARLRHAGVHLVCACDSDARLRAPAGRPERLGTGMPALRDFLARFRPAGPPGAAARAGVPADRSRELEAEVGPVLALLESTDAERERIIAQARRDAGQITAEAQAEAAAIAADAEQRAKRAREEAARQVVALARDEAAGTVEGARQQAIRTRELARQRMPALVSQAVETIWQLQCDST
jgi:nucleotide-binding universal stress UspA family protein